MFEIVWLKDGDMVLREEIGYRTLADAVTFGRKRAPDVAKRLAGREPDRFRLIDLSSAASSVHSIDGEDA